MGLRYGRSRFDLQTSVTTTEPHEANLLLNIKLTQSTESVVATHFGIYKLTTVMENKIGFHILSRNTFPGH